MNHGPELHEIASTMSPIVFRDLGLDTPAKTYVEWACLQGEMMGRILAALMWMGFAAIRWPKMSRRGSAIGRSKT